MIPFLQITNIHVGAVTIQFWGLMVALGILAGAFVSTKLAEKRGQDKKIIWDLTFWVIVGAFIFARLLMVFYEPTFYLSAPLELLKIWNGGFSIIGGFVGATLFGILFLRKQKVNVWQYCDTAIFGLPLGLFIGRIGCFFIHDHPGRFTNIFFGVLYPDGMRHDLGLYLSINSLMMFLVFLLLAYKKIKTGTFITVFLIWYGVVRFFLDFLRATNGPIVDARYFDLTPAQYFSIIMFIAGMFLVKKLANKS